MRLSAVGAVIWGAALAGVLDIGAVFAFWAARDVAPATILQSIASSVLGQSAYEQGAGAAALGLLLYFAVSLVFAAAYVAVSARVRLLRPRPIMPIALVTSRIGASGAKLHEQPS